MIGAQGPIGEQVNAEADKGFDLVGGVDQVQQVGAAVGGDHQIDVAVWTIGSLGN